MLIYRYIINLPYALSLFLLLFITSFATTSFAAETIILKEGVHEYPLGINYDTLEDKEKKWSIEDVSSPPVEELFVSAKRPSPTFGVSSSAHWLRITVHNRLDNSMDMRLESFYGMVDRVELYIPKDGGGFTEKVVGDNLPMSVREIKHPHLIFDVTFAPGEEVTLYLRAESEDALVLPFNFVTKEKFLEKDKYVWIFFGLHFGILLVAVFYNLFIYLSLRDPSYLHYVIYISCWILTGLVLNRLDVMFLWSESPWFANWLVIGAPATTELFGAVFTRTFLATHRTAPSLDKALKYFIWYSVIIVVVSFLVPDRATLIYIVILSSMVYSGLVLSTGYILWRRDVREARFFLLAFVLVNIAIVVFCLMLLNLIPFSFLVNHSMDIGVSIEAILLSLALADKINIMQNEKEIAQRKTIEQERVIQETLRKSKEELETKVAQRTEGLNSAKEQAEAATKLKDKFVSLVSHDLRSPLGSILNMLEMVKHPKKYKITIDKREDLIEGATGATRRLMKLVEQLLDISMLKTGKIVPLKKFFNLHKVTLSSLVDITHAADNKEVTIVNEIPKDMLIFADPTLIGEVIHNILSNAIKFTSKGDVITLFAPETEGRIAIAIKDTGPGIAENIIDDLFKQEVKTTSIGSAGEKGTGLGLPYCFDIALAHGGELTVESKPGEGAIFTIILPEVKTIVLLVDDQQAHREMMKKLILTISDAEILEAENGREALAILKETTPHLVITDVQMPEMNGLELLDIMKKSPILDSVPIIVATSQASSSDSAGIDVRQTALSNGADDFINKPVSRTEFIPRVRRLLGD